MPDPRIATCDHCHHVCTDLRTHLLPRTIRLHHTDSDQISDYAHSLLLCSTCGDQRQQDLWAFFNGAHPTELVCQEQP